jgi:hypothetical protein
LTVWSLQLVLARVLPLGAKERAATQFVVCIEKSGTKARSVPFCLSHK